MPDPEESPNALVSVQELRDHMSGATLRTDQARDAAVTLIGLQRGLEAVGAAGALGEPSEE